MTDEYKLQREESLESLIKDTLVGPLANNAAKLAATHLLPVLTQWFAKWHELAVGITVEMDSTAARQVADFLDGLIGHQHLEPDDLKKWEGVRDALWAFSNDTDCITHIEGEGNR